MKLPKLIKEINTGTVILKIWEFKRYGYTSRYQTIHPLPLKPNK